MKHNSIELRDQVFAKGFLGFYLLLKTWVRILVKI